MAEPSAFQMMIDSQKRIEANQVESYRRLEAKLDHMMQHGCSKLSIHESVYSNQTEIFKRIKAIENENAEARGKLVVVMLIAGAVIGYAVSMGFRWIGNQF